MQTLSHRQRAQAIAWVPQAHDGIFAFSVLDMVLMGLAPAIGAFSVPGKQERLKATNAGKAGHFASGDTTLEYA